MLQKYIKKTSYMWWLWESTYINVIIQNHQDLPTTSSHFQLSPFLALNCWNSSSVQAWENQEHYDSRGCRGKKSRPKTPIIYGGDQIINNIKSSSQKWTVTDYSMYVFFWMIQIGYEASRTQNSKIAPNSPSFSISWSHLSDNLATIKGHLAHHDKHSLHTKHHTLEINNVPMPAPVPPPKEWQSWKPCKQSPCLSYSMVKVEGLDFLGRGIQRVWFVVLIATM